MITHERLLEVMHYDPLTGIARWRIRPHKHANRIKPGDIMARKNDRYCIVSIDNVTYQLHRLIFFYMTGEWPKDEIDHRSNEGHINKWENLRDATRRENEANKPVSKKSKTGLKGVEYIPHLNKSNPYRSTIRVDGKKKHLGCFDCPAAASFRYQIEADKLYGEFARIK